jgi:hypothetical protein
MLLSERPDWSFADPRFPSFERLMDAMEAVVAANPGTTFVGVHVGCFAEDLGWVGRMLDTLRQLPHRHRGPHSPSSVANRAPRAH